MVELNSVFISILCLRNPYLRLGTFQKNTESHTLVADYYSITAGSNESLNVVTPSETGWYIARGIIIAR